MSFVAMLAAGSPLVVLLVYIVARVAALGWFQSARQLGMMAPPGVKDQREETKNGHV